MHEIPKSAFPYGWEYAEGRHPEDVIILAHDSERRYAAFRYSPPAERSSIMDRRWGEFFYDSLGRQTDYIVNTTSLAEIGIRVPGKTSTRYTLCYNQKTPLGRVNQLNVSFFSWLEDEVPDQGEWMHVGQISYWGNTLGGINTCSFLSADRKTFVKSPSGVVLERTDAGRRKDAQFAFPLPRYAGYARRYVVPTGDWMISWDEIDRQGTEPLFITSFLQEDGVIILEQKHIITNQGNRYPDKIKLVRVPVNIDKDLVYATFHPELPSGTINPQGEMSVPWRSITKAVDGHVHIIG